MSPETSELTLVVVDNGAPWVRSLFAAMPPDVAVHNLRINSLGAGGFRALAAACKIFSVEQIGPNQWQHYTVIPGWSRAYRISTTIAAAKVRRLVRRLRGGRAVVVYNCPQLADVARKLAGAAAQVYHVNDAFRYYAWDSAQVAQWESQLLSCCSLGLASSQGIAADLRADGFQNIAYFPNAVSSSFLGRMQQPPQSLPDLAGEKGFIVGCTGQINRSYDWRLIEGLAMRCTGAVQVFVGPIIEADPVIRADIQRVLALPNIRWLGPKPHDALPDYLRRFDVCLNPLAVNEHNNRRCPLRFYDYLATDKPIISTAINEAAMHRPHVLVAQDVMEMAAMLEKIQHGGYQVDVASRRRYIVENTWEKRAGQLMGLLRAQPNKEPPVIGQPEQRR